MKLSSFKITQKVKAPRRRVYKTWTDPKLSKGFSAPPGCVAKLFTTDFRVGGKYRASMSTPHGMMKSSGEYLAIEPNQRIVQTFVWDAPETELNVITLEFSDRGKETLLTLTGQGFAEKDEAEGNRGGWQGSLKQFADFFDR